MMESPVKYAKSDEVHVAYRTFGDGDHDIEVYWESRRIQ
jgi:hypothetical protein